MRENRLKGPTHHMDAEIEIIREELPDVEELIQTACAVEALVRHEPVDRRDPEVQSLVADLILSGAGEVMRRRHSPK